MEAQGQAECPLSGLRILDLADRQAGFCTKLLADLGASVIKIERPGGDPSRKIGPFLGESPHPERSLFFRYHNIRKMGITLNLEHPEGRRLFFRLIETSDAAVETFSPGYLDRLGIGFESLAEIRPGIILASVTPFGQTGPRKGFKGCDLTASALGGQMYVSGSPSSPPLKAFGEQSYYVSSLFAAVAVLLALRKRAVTGKGEHIDLSVQESVASTLEQVMVRHFFDHVIPKRQGPLHWDRSFCILPCREGHLLLTPFQQWETLVEWMESEGMAEDLGEEEYRDETYRLSRFDHIVQVLKRWTGAHTAEELFQVGQRMRFPWAPVLSPKGVLENPQLRARGFFVKTEDPGAESGPSHPGPPYRWSGGMPEGLARAPHVGEHNVLIYQEELGVSPQEMERLASVGAI